MTATACSDTRQKHPPLGECDFQPAIDGLRERLNLALRGKEEAVERTLACLLARGHLLIEDLPGLGKTTLAKALAHAIGGQFARVQCTPDLLPADVTGFNLFNQKVREFEFVPGPVFSDVLLADEINRATPRTQSALFEAMAERQVTVDNVCRHLPESFFVIATQNPVEQQGTYPLPEAQLDRFAMRLSIGYADRDIELNLLASAIGESRHDLVPTEPIIDPGRLQQLQAHVAHLDVVPAVRAYIVDLVRASRDHPAVTLGVSPRGMLLWQRVAQAWAHLHGRGFVTPDDVQDVAEPVLGVRLIGEFESVEPVVRELLDQVPVPVS